MAELVLALAIVFGVVALLGLLAVGLLVRSVRRSVRVTRHDRIGAPVSWLALPGPASSLHRRLRRSVQALRTAVPPPTKRQQRKGQVHQLHRLAHEIEQHASVVAADVVVVARLRGPERQRALAGLRTQVEQIEGLCARVAIATPTISSIAPAPADPAVLGRLTDELDALEAAHAELAALERGVGLGPVLPAGLPTGPHQVRPLPPPGTALPR